MAVALFRKGVQWAREASFGMRSENVFYVSQLTGIGDTCLFQHLTKFEKLKLDLIPHFFPHPQILMDRLWGLEPS